MFLRNLKCDKSFQCMILIYLRCHSSLKWHLVSELGNLIRIFLEGKRKRKKRKKKEERKIGKFCCAVFEQIEEIQSGLQPTMLRFNGVFFFFLVDFIFSILSRQKG